MGRKAIREGWGQHVEKFESQATELKHLIVTSVEHVKDTHVGLVLSTSPAAPEMFQTLSQPCTFEHSIPSARNAISDSFFLFSLHLSSAHMKPSLRHSPCPALGSSSPILLQYLGFLCSIEFVKLGCSYV